MPRLLALAALAVAALVARSTAAATSLTVPAGGGLGALSVAVDVARRELRYAPCRAEPCPPPPATGALVIPAGDAPLAPGDVRVEDVVLAGGRHVAHVKVPLGADTTPEGPAWEALLGAGSPPLFAGKTGWSRGEPGERSGTAVRLLTDGGHTVIVVGEIREDLRICGDDATLLDPRSLDPATMGFRGATLQRLSVARRAAATPVMAIPRRGPAEATLARLLTAGEASSAIGPAAALTDGDPATSWSEARPGRGQGEFVLMRAPYDVPIVRFSVTVAPTSPAPGGAAPEVFYLATGAATYEVTLPEDAWSHPGEAYDVPLPAPVTTSCVALVLGDAFTRGRPHPEVTVAELAAYSAFDHAGATLGEVAAALRGGGARAGAAAALLERAGGAGVAAMAGVYPTLDAAARALAMNVAASAGSCESSAPLFVEALSDDDEVVRRKARTKLEEPACGREALPTLTAALRRGAARAKVAPMVAFIGRDRSVGALVEALGDGTPEERQVVRSAVAYAARGATPADLAPLLASSVLRSAEATLDVLRALHERLPDVREAADASVTSLLAGPRRLDERYLLVEELARLAASGDAAAQGHLADLVRSDPAPEVRARAAEQLASARDPGAVAAGALGDAEPRVREAALHAVGEGRLGAASAGAVALLERDPWTFVRVAAATALATLPAGPAVDRALGDALGQRSPRVREQATLALAARGASAYRDVIRRHLIDVREEPPVRAAAARALGQLCDGGAVDALVSLAVSGASSPDAVEVSLGLVATEALGALHPRDLSVRFAPMQAKGVRPDARAAAARAVDAPARCPLP